MTPDVNVLVAASRADHPHHAQALSWLTEALDAAEDGRTMYLLPMVGSGFLRLVTHPKVFAEPTPIKSALAFLQAVLKAPGVEWFVLGQEWKGFERLCLDKNLAGNKVPDAWIAAAVKAGHLHLVTFDQGFAQLLDRSELTVLRP